MFQDSDFAGHLEDSKSTSGGPLGVFGSQTFVPIKWMCKKQTSVSHSSTESDVISLDAGLRMDGITALGLYDLVIEVLHSSSNQPEKSKENVQGNLLHDTPSRKHTNSQTTNNDLELCNVDFVSSHVKSSQFGAMLNIFEDTEAVIIDKSQRSQGKTNVLNNIDCVLSNVQSSHQEALLYVFEDNEAVIKMVIKGRSPTMRHVSRTHRVALDWSFDRINLHFKNQARVESRFWRHDGRMQRKNRAS